MSVRMNGAFTTKKAPVEQKLDRRFFCGEALWKVCFKNVHLYGASLCPY
ncbi:MAG: hypothetical protein U0350_51805 [Caldilineaceae bacterium]